MYLSKPILIDTSISNVPSPFRLANFGLPPLKILSLSKIVNFRLIFNQKGYLIIKNIKNVRPREKKIVRGGRIVRGGSRIVRGGRIVREGSRIVRSFRSNKIQ
jgi:hypothetical protein